METLLENLKEHVTCPICLDTFTEPKTIACLHTFCCECLKKHVLTTQRQGQYRCPECQAQVGVPESFDKLPTGFLQNSLLGVLAVQQSGDGSEICCSNCRRKSAETSFCFNCGKFMCSDCVNAHELLRNVAFDDHKIRPIKHFETKDYEALLKRESSCSQQYHAQEVTRFFCLECQTCVCQVCVVTDHRNHAVDPLDKAADREKVQFMRGTELMKEKSNICSDVLREFEQTALNLETNIATAKSKVSQATEQIITKVREREQEAITALEITRVSRTEKLNSVKTQVQSLLKQINQTIEFADNLVQRSSSSAILQSKESLEQRFQDLYKTPVPLISVTSFVKFISTFEPKNLTLGFMATKEPVVAGLKQDFQVGEEAELVIFPKLTSEAQRRMVQVLVEPAQEVARLMSCAKEDKSFLVKFIPKVPGIYNIQVTINAGNLHQSIFTGHVQVKERRLEVVGELDLKGETLQNPCGIAVNSEGLIAIADFSGHCILLFDKEGKYLRKFGRKGKNVGQLYNPADVTFVTDDEILVADVLNQRIHLFNVNTGDGVKDFGKMGEAEGEIHNPVGVFGGGADRVVVADGFDNRMQVFTKDAEPVLSFGESGPGKLNCPTGCIFHENNFIVSDAKNHCLKIFDNSGRFLRKIGEEGKGDGQLNWPEDLCVEKCGNHHNILVCDRNNQGIVQFTMEGSFAGKTFTKLQKPVGIATTPDGKILVSDFSARKIYILQ